MLVQGTRGPGGARLGSHREQMRGGTGLPHGAYDPGGGGRGAVHWFLCLQERGRGHKSPHPLQRAPRDVSAPFSRATCILFLPRRPPWNDLPDAVTRKQSRQHAGRLVSLP